MILRIRVFGNFLQFTRLKLLWGTSLLSIVEPSHHTLERPIPTDSPLLADGVELQSPECSQRHIRQAMANLLILQAFPKHL